jgi:hypothetical protein
VRCDSNPYDYYRQDEHDQVGQGGAGGQGDHFQQLQDGGVHGQDKQDNKEDHKDADTNELTTGKDLSVHINNIDCPGKPDEQSKGGDHGQGEGCGRPQLGGEVGQDVVRLQQRAVQDRQEGGHDGGVDSWGGGKRQVRRGAAGQDCQE